MSGEDRGLAKGTSWGAGPLVEGGRSFTVISGWFRLRAARSDREIPRLRFDRDPAHLRERIDPRLAAKSAIARILDTPERHLRLIVYGGAVDVANAGVDLWRHAQASGGITRENRR